MCAESAPSGPEDSGAVQEAEAYLAAMLPERPTDPTLNMMRRVLDELAETQKILRVVEGERDRAERQVGA